MAMDLGDAKITISADDKISGQLDSIGKKMGGLSKTFQKSGLIMMGAGAVLGGGLIALAKGAAEFEGAMLEVNTMIGLTDEGFEALSEEVKAVSSQVGKSSEELAGALYQIVSAGIDSADAINVLAVASKAAVAGVTSVETAADGLTTVLNAFKIPAEEVTRVADIMFATVKRGKTTFEELSASLFNVAPIAAAAGISFEEVAAALATMTKQGVPTSVATTQLRAAIQQLLKPTTEMIEIVSELGIELFNETEASQKAKDALIPLRKGITTASIAFGKQTEELDDLRFSYKETTAAMSATDQEMDELSDTQSRLQLEIRKLKQEINLAESAFTPLDEAVITATTAFDEQSRELEELQRAYQVTTQAMSDMAGEMDDLGDRQTVIRLKIRKLRFKATKEGRELTEEEIEQIAKLKLEMESLGIAYAELAIKKDDASEAAEKEADNIAKVVSENQDLKTAIVESEEATKGLTDAEIARVEAIKLLEAEIESLGIAHDELAIKKDDASEAAEKEAEALQVVIDRNSDLQGAIGESQEALKAGILVYQDSEKELKTFEEIIKELDDTTGLTTTKILKMFGSIEAGSAILALTGENAATFAEDLIATSENAAGSVEAAYAIMSEGVGREFELLFNDIKELGNEIGETLLPIFKEIMEKLKPIITSFKDWVVANEDLFPTLLKVAGILIGVGGILFALAQVAKMIMVVNAALVILHTLSGPAGWAKLAIGIALAAGAMVAISKMIPDFSFGLDGAETRPVVPEFISEEEKAATGLPPAPSGKFWFHDATGWHLRSLPGFQFGGVVPGPIGQPIPIIAHGGEVFAGVGGRMGTTINLTVEGSVVTEQDLLGFLRREFILEKDRNVTTGF